MQSTSIDEESRFNAVQIPEIEAQQMQSTSSSSNFTRTRRYSIVEPQPYQHQSTAENGTTSPNSNHSGESTSSVKLATTALVGLANDSRNYNSNSQSKSSRKNRQHQNSSESSNDDDDDSLDPPSPAYSPADNTTQTHQHSLNAAPKKTNRKKAEGFIARPANAFILYRSEQIKLLKSTNAPKKPQSEVSKLIGTMWRDLPKAEKANYMTLAAEEKARHIEKFPDYRFSPVRRNSEPKVKAPRGPYAVKIQIRKNSAPTLLIPTSTSNSLKIIAPPPFRRSSTNYIPQPATFILPPNVTRSYSEDSQKSETTPIFRSVAIVSARPRPLPIVPISYRSQSTYLPSPLLEHPLSPPTTSRQEFKYHLKSEPAHSPILPPSPPYAPESRIFTRVSAPPAPLTYHQAQEAGQNHYQSYNYNQTLRNPAVLPPPPLYDSYRHHQQQLQQQEQDQQAQQARSPIPQQQSQYWTLPPSSESSIPKTSPQFLHPGSPYGISTPGKFHPYLTQQPDAQHHVLPYSVQLSPYPPTAITSAGDYFVPAKGNETLHYNLQGWETSV